MFRAPSPCSVATLLLAYAAMLAPLDAAAQTVDYEALEQVFGEPVTTSVTGKPQRASEAAASVVIITREDIRRSPARDIPALISAYAGIDVVRWTAAHTDVAVRGGIRPDNPGLLVMVNGRQAYLDHYGMTNWNLLGVALDEIQQIEVIAGPNSALFGFNAATGVVNIITIDPLRTQQAATSAQVGTEGQVQLAQSVAVKLSDAIGVRASASYTRSQELDGLNGSAAAPLGGFDADSVSKSANAELFLQPGVRTEMGLSLAHATSRQNDFVPNALVHPNDYKLTSLDAHVSHDTGWGALSARAFRNWTNVIAAGDGAIGATIADNMITSASANALVRLGSAHVVRAGVEFRDNKLNVNNGFSGSSHERVFAGSLMWEGTLSDRLTATAAGRVDRLNFLQHGLIDQPVIYSPADYDRALTTWSVNGALRYKLDDTTSLRLSGGRGIQAPSLFDLSLRLVASPPQDPFPYVLGGNPLLRPSIVDSGEIGLSRGLGEQAQLELTAYYSHVDVTSISGYDTPPFAAPPAYPFVWAGTDNVGGYRVWGITAAINGRFGTHWSWLANYSWTHVDERVDGHAGGARRWPLSLEDATPEHKLKGQLSYEAGRWLVSAAARYGSSTSHVVASAGFGLTPTTVMVRIGDSLGIDARIAYRVHRNLSLEVAGENLADDASAGLSPIPAERRLRAGLRVRF